MFGNWLEIMLIAIILGGIGLVIWKGGAANPVGTDTLRSKLGALDNDLRAVKTKVDTVETRVAELDQRAATKGDIERIENRLVVWESKFEGLDRRLDNTELGVGRIEAEVSALKRVIEAMAEGQRVSNQSLHGIADRVSANGAITAQVPAFMERVLRDTATTAAESQAVRSQVDRLYDIITTRGMSA